jgi:alpha-beta hydrolase superfamily lysophospholipase
LIELTGRGPTGLPAANCQWLRASDRVRQGYKVRFFLKSLELGHAARLSSRELRLPVLALEGGKDRVVVRNSEERKTYDTYLRHELRGGRADVLFYPDGYHTLTVGTTQDTALRDIRRWIARNLPRGSPPQSR